MIFNESIRYKTYGIRKRIFIKTINRSLSILYYAYSFRSFNNQHRNNAHKNLLI